MKGNTSFFTLLVIFKKTHSIVYLKGQRTKCYFCILRSGFALLHCISYLDLKGACQSNVRFPHQQYFYDSRVCSIFTYFVSDLPKFSGSYQAPGSDMLAFFHYEM